MGPSCARRARLIAAAISVPSWFLSAVPAESARATTVAESGKATTVQRALQVRQVLTTPECLRSHPLGERLIETLSWDQGGCNDASGCDLPVTCNYGAGNFIRWFGKDARSLYEQILRTCPREPYLQVTEGPYFRVAIDGLSYLQGHSARKLVLDVFNDESYSKWNRLAALKGYLHAAGPHRGPFLAHLLLAEKAPEIRQRAALEFLNKPDPHTRDAIVKSLRTAEGSVARTLADALDRIDRQRPASDDYPGRLDEPANWSIDRRCGKPEPPPTSKPSMPGSEPVHLDRVRIDTGSVALSTEPPGAMFKVDGRGTPSQRTPFVVDNLPTERPVVVTFMLIGYKRKEVTITLHRSATTPVAVTLESLFYSPQDPFCGIQSSPSPFVPFGESGTLSVTCIPTSTVIIDGEATKYRAGTHPVLISVSAGSHTVSCVTDQGRQGPTLECYITPGFVCEYRRKVQ
jgi:hypothetical protein